MVRYKATNAQQYLGGVAGMVQSCTLRSSFATGIINGYSNESCVGGVTGLLTGNIVDCYSSGLVHCYSRMTGGLVGQIQLGASKLSPEVRNCYTSATVECETYQYNRENCAEVIGKILDGSNPVLENIYYDSQVTNFYSTRFGALTSVLTSAEGPRGFSSDVWRFVKGAYPRIKATRRYRGRNVQRLSGRHDTFRQFQETLQQHSHYRFGQYPIQVPQRGPTL